VRLPARSRGYVEVVLARQHDVVVMIATAFACRLPISVLGAAVLAAAVRGSIAPGVSSLQSMAEPIVTYAIKSWGASF